MIHAPPREVVVQLVQRLLGAAEQTDSGAELVVSVRVGCLEKGAISVLRQFTHGAWADLKTANSRRRIPLAKELVRQLRLHRLRTPGELVFPGPTGHPIDYHNWRARVWAPLLKKVNVTGTFHMLGISSSRR